MSDPSLTASAFRGLHAGPDLLILPNVWDAGSARLIESLGAKAIATTSSGVSWTHGYGDGERLPIDLYVASVRAIAGAVGLPISVDAEGGYAQDPQTAADLVSRLIDAGAAGLNLEDGFEAPARLCAKIEAVKASAERRGVDVFVNARTDVGLKGLAPGREVEETLARAALYASAGADGLFTPGVTDAAALAAIVEATPLPVNVMARPNLPPLAELRAIGVRRLSAGGALSQAAFGLTRRLTEGFLTGDLSALFDGAMSYPDINALMRG